MGYEVDVRKRQPLHLGLGDTVEGVLQNVYVALATMRESAPLYMGFGLSWRTVDMPMNAARALLVADITEVIQDYEPLAVIEDIRFEVDTDKPGRVSPIVEVGVSNAES